MTIRTLEHLHKRLIDEAAKQETLLTIARDRLAVAWDRSLASDADPGGCLKERSTAEETAEEARRAYFHARNALRDFESQEWH